MITFDRVVKRYANSVAVDHLSLEIKSGETVILVGPSGCGKTTSLKMINRLVEPTEGAILIDDRDTRTYDVNDLRRSIGYVIQQVGLFPHQTVAENIATVPRLLGWTKQRIAARVEELLELIALPPAEYARRLPSELSGGERQRVGVARALGADPNILLMDEPFGAIDPIARERLQNELLRLQSVVRKTIVFVTHDIDEAVKLGDRVALLSRGRRARAVRDPGGVAGQPAVRVRHRVPRRGSPGAQARADPDLRGQPATAQRRRAGGDRGGGRDASRRARCRASLARMGAFE